MSLFFEKKTVLYRMFVPQWSLHRDSGDVARSNCLSVVLPTWDLNTVFKVMQVENFSFTWYEKCDLDFGSKSRHCSTFGTRELKVNLAVEAEHEILTASRQLNPRNPELETKLTLMHDYDWLNRLQSQTITTFLFSLTFTHLRAFQVY